MGLWRRVIAGSVLCLHGASSIAAQDFAGRNSMNGIDWSAYKDFPQNWQMVTVRYRQDTSEMRFVYANDIAAQALKAGVTDYPDGAVFGKVGALTKQDLLFPSSMIPSGVRRFQLMVRNKSLYKDTDGWGYALFDEAGKTQAEDPRLMALACAACHRLANVRGQVFSTALSEVAHSRVAWIAEDRFRVAQRADLPEFIQKLLPQHITQIKQLRGELEKNLFQGTLDEIKPVLAQEAVRSSMPALLLSSDKKRYSLVFPTKDKCPDNQGIRLKTVHSLADKERQSLSSEFCQK